MKILGANAPKTINFIDRAQTLGRRFVNVPLKDGSSAKLSLGENGFDCVILKNNRMLGCKTYSGTPEKTIEKFASVLDELKKYAVDPDAII